MENYTLNELRCFVTVIDAGGFQQAAERLHRSHPAVFTAVAKLEQRLDLKLLDRSGYRVRPTPAGRALHEQAQLLLKQAEQVDLRARELAMGEETQLRIVLGDLCPRSQVLRLLGTFFARHRRTRLQLHYEAVTGPWERLFDDEADLIVHRIDKTDERLEWIDLGRVRMVPVVAPGFLPFAPSRTITPTRMRPFTQAVLRDTVRRADGESHFLVRGANECSVADHQMKKEIILAGMAWGHLPQFLIADDLARGRLLSIAGRYFPGVVEDLVVARRVDRPRGPIGNRLWDHLRQGARDVRAFLV